MRLVLWGPDVLVGRPLDAALPPHALQHLARQAARDLAPVVGGRVGAEAVRRRRRQPHPLLGGAGVHCVQGRGVRAGKHHRPVRSVFSGKIGLIDRLPCNKCILTLHVINVINAVGHYVPNQES